MSKGKPKHVSFAAGAEEAASLSQPDNLYKGFVADGSLREVPIEPRLDCSPEGLGQDKELWLLQLPMELDPSKHAVHWTVDRAAGGAIRAHCTVDGANYELVSDREQTTVPLYATPSTRSGKLARVARRVTVLRATQAPQICFGQGEDAQRTLSPAQPAAAVAAAQPSPTKKAPKKAKQLQPGPLAPVISEPRTAVPAAAAEAAPNKSNLTANGGGQGPEPAAPVAEGAGAVGAAGGEDGKAKKKKKKRKAEEGGQAGEASAAGGKEKKKHKKDKQKDKQ